MNKSSVFGNKTHEDERVNKAVDKCMQEITFREFDGKTLTPWQTAYNLFKLFEEIVNNTNWK